jgi:hypothetical protein
MPKLSSFLGTQMPRWTKMPSLLLKRSETFGSLLRQSSHRKSLYHVTSKLYTKSFRYINFAYGDEGLEAIYDESLPRLQTLKKKHDPNNRFNQWFNIQ